MFCLSLWVRCGSNMFIISMVEYSLEIAVCISSLSASSSCSDEFFFNVYMYIIMHTVF